ncbi:hypothetical protein GCM10018777_56680 [Streptomyces albogriseolus]|uniref:hypothetical protein n=1 Tax=Streptomyces TaxID=1883 RepID=UPI0019BE9A9E|nr:MULTISPECIES: hypothetical protein [Streptomyces]GHB14582.1 hypothetical protein GCM10010330_80330 [Streptomyces tendae]GHG33215.1 hypothetical protein GCM10018777_56680 [Streptomyces viridodiastaticus]
MTLRPSQLPKVRRQTLRHLREPSSSIRSGVSADTAESMGALASVLEVGELFWVQQDMAALAMHAGEQLAAARWATADRPAPCGLLYWQDGIGHMEAQGVQVPVEACAWGPYQGELLVWLLMSRDRLVAEAAAARPELEIVVEKVPPLIPIFAAMIPVTAEPLPMVELGSEVPQPVLAALASAWLLMQQPLLVDRVRERADKPTVRAYARDGLPSPEVTVVDLRRQYTPQDQDPDQEGPGRHYKHRWIVSGHWRDQAYGPGRSLRRKTWVPSYVKGPEGAPLLSTEKVNVWRR